MSNEYCVKCGNTGRTLEGTACECLTAPTLERFNRGDMEYIEVPQAYRGVQFDKNKLDPSLVGNLPDQMLKVYEQIKANVLTNYNCCICTPPNTGKTVLAYTCLTHLFKSGYKVFPLLDVMEIKSIFEAIERNRKPMLDVQEPLNVLEAPIIFVRIHQAPSFEHFSLVNTIMDRRVRRGLSTIFLYGGAWEQLVFTDNSKLITSLKGDGSFKSLDVISI